MNQPQRDPNLESCIADCLDCYRTCQQTAVIDSLMLGGKHVAPGHFRAMLECAEACRFAAAMMLSASTFTAATCALCADICRACAQSCCGLGGLEECATACDRCADSCDELVRAAGGGGREVSSGRSEQRAQ